MESNCQFCLKLIPSTTKSKVNKVNNVAVSQLWSYLYHQNVQEGCASRDTFSKSSEDKSAVPKLAFSFSVCDDDDLFDEKEGVETLKICALCSEELKKLDKLHNELERLKKLIDSQMKKINRMWHSSNEEENTVTILSLLRTMRKPPTTQTSFGGSAMGKENVHRVLKFLDTFCLEVASTQEASTSRPPGSTAKVNNKCRDKLKIHVPIVSEQDEESGNTLVSESPSSSNYEDVETIEIDKMEDEEIKIALDYYAPIVNYATPQFTMTPVVQTSPKNHYQDAFQSTSHTPSSISPTSPTGKVHVKKQCPICGKWVASYYLRAHCKTHTGVKPHLCKICNKGFTQRSSYNLHRRLHHQGSEGRSNQSRSNLKCSLCSMDFGQKHSLKLHLQRHHKLSNHAIEQLPMDESCVFLDPVDGREHQNSFANDIKEFITPIEGLLLSKSQVAAAATSSSSSTSGGSKYEKKQCPICNKWLSPNYFMSHQRVHTGEKPYLCDICNSRFTQKSACNLHMRIQHNLPTGRLSARYQ